MLVAVSEEVSPCVIGVEEAVSEEEVVMSEVVVGVEVAVSETPTAVVSVVVSGVLVALEVSEVVSVAAGVEEAAAEVATESEVDVSEEDEPEPEESEVEEEAKPHTPGVTLIAPVCTSATVKQPTCPLAS